MVGACYQRYRKKIRCGLPAPPTVDFVSSIACPLNAFYQLWGTEEYDIRYATMF